LVNPGLKRIWCNGFHIHPEFVSERFLLWRAAS
jgi:hypothetical protein